MQIYTIIIPTKQKTGDRIYDTGDGCVQLREVTIQDGEDAPTAAAYEVVNKRPQEVAEARSWTSSSP